MSYLKQRRKQLSKWMEQVNSMHPIMRPCMQGYWCGMPGAMGMGGETMFDAWVNWKGAAMSGEWSNGVHDWKYLEWVDNHYV